MQKIYVIYEGSHECDSIVGIFATKEIAESAKKKYTDDFCKFKSICAKISDYMNSIVIPKRGENFDKEWDEIEKNKSEIIGDDIDLFNKFNRGLFYNPEKLFIKERDLESSISFQTF